MSASGSLEKLHRSLMPFGSLAGIEGAEVPAPLRPRIDFSGIQPVLAGAELADHAASLAKVIPTPRNRRRVSASRRLQPRQERCCRQSATDRLRQVLRQQLVILRYRAPAPRSSRAAISATCRPWKRAPSSSFSLG